tara:strand:- start:51 stop:365 length:315 start_codon:yes stop_codon:yes gene_type:complete
MITYYEAVEELVGGGFGGPSVGPVSSYVFYDGQTPPSEEAIQTKLAEMQAEYDSQEYARNRKEEYDALNQFELISDDDANGTTSHKDAIATIKTKWPKDNSGPV